MYEIHANKKLTRKVACITYEYFPRPTTIWYTIPELESPSIEQEFVQCITGQYN
jgi:hypothetical protein